MAPMIPPKSARGTAKSIRAKREAPLDCVGDGVLLPLVVLPVPLLVGGGVTVLVAALVVVVEVEVARTAETLATLALLKLALTELGRRLAVNGGAELPASVSAGKVVQLDERPAGCAEGVTGSPWEKVVVTPLST